MPFGDHIAQVTIRGSIHGQQTINVLNFASDGAVPPDNSSSLNSLVQGVRTVVETYLLPAVSEDWTLEEFRGKTLHPVASDEIVISPTGGPMNGTLGPADISFVAALISFRTGLAGKSRRGRMFVAGVPEDHIIDSRLTETYIGLLNTFAGEMSNAFVSNITPPEYAHVVLSRVTNGAPRPLGPEAVRPITNYKVDPRARSMVSRRSGHGR